MIPAVFLFILGVIAFSRPATISRTSSATGQSITVGLFGVPARHRVRDVRGNVGDALAVEDYRFILLAPMGWAWWTSICRFTLNPGSLIGCTSARRIGMIGNPASHHSVRCSAANGLIRVRMVKDRFGVAPGCKPTFEALVFYGSIAAYFLLR